MSTNHSSACLLWCASLLAATALGAEFPDADGSGDLASAAAWGGTLPGTAETVAVTGNVDTTVHASGAVTFGQLVSKLTPGCGWTLTFDQTAYPDAALKFAGFRNGNGVKQHNLHVHFKGGTWDFGGKHFASAGSDTYGNERSITVSDHATLGNIDNIILGYTAQNKLRLEILGGSRVEAKNFKFTNNMTGRDTPNVLLVSGGSELKLTGGMSRENSPQSWEQAMGCQPDGGFHYKDYVIVSNADSVLRFAAADSIYFGSYGGGVTLATDSGKLVVSGTSYLWNSYTRNNLLRAEKQGSIEFASTTTAYGGWGDASGQPVMRYNRIEAADGGSITMGYLRLGYSVSAATPNIGNTLWVSNGTFTARRIDLGNNEGCSNQLVHVLGPKSVFTLTDSAAMFVAPYCEWRAEDGAVVPTMAAFSNMATGTHDETLRACNGGIIAVGEKLSTSTSAAAEGLYSGRNNQIIVESGSSLTGGVVLVQGEACGLRVENARVGLSGSSNNYSLRIGYLSKYGGLSTNCCLTIAGSRPQIALTNSLEVVNGSTVRFELPAQGYESGVVPLQFGGGLVFDESTCSLEFSGMDAMAAGHAELGRSVAYVLAENPADKGFFPDSAVAAAQERLGDGFVLKTCVKDGKNQLLLKVCVPAGMMILFK